MVAGSDEHGDGRGAMVTAMGRRRADSLLRHPFNLSRWFALVGLVSIASISAMAGYLISDFVTGRMVRQEGQLTMEIVQNLVLTEKSFLALFSATARDEIGRASCRERV